MHITACFRSPVKSCALEERITLPITQGLVEFDRRWVLVSPGDAFLSQRGYPSMSKIQQKQLDADRIQLTGRDGSVINLTTRINSRDSAEVRIWEEGEEKLRQCIEVDPFYSEWFTKELGTPCRLIAQHPDNLKKKEQGEHQFAISLHDSSPLHLVTIESLKWLELDEPEHITAQRFRPNIVVEGVGYPFAEDTWEGKRIRIDSFTYLIRKKTMRCSIPGVDPVVGDQDNLPMKKLNRERREGNKIFFGMYLFPLFREGSITCGDEVLIQ